MMKICERCHESEARTGETLCIHCLIAAWVASGNGAPLPDATLQPCGHPAADIAQSDAGTAYCRTCETLGRR